MEQLRTVLYVGDSSFVTPEAVERAQGLALRWLSRVPRIYGWVTNAVDTAWNQADQWKSLKTDSESMDYWQAIPEGESLIGSVTVRAILIYSKRLEAQKQHTFGRQWEKTRAQGERAWAHLPRKRPPTRPPKLGWPTTSTEDGPF